jgi:hypothetical protein
MSSAYGFVCGAWAFGVVEAIWSEVTLRRYRSVRRVVAGPTG